DEKYLFRVEGETDRDDDDVLLEFKEVRDLKGVGCIRDEPGPTRILVGQARLAYQPFRYPGAVHAGGLSFWVHPWPLNYAELDIDALRSVDELCEVVYDSGVQLGRGHPKRWAQHEAVHLRRRLAAELSPERVARVTEELALLTRESWERFRAATNWR